MGEGGSLRRGGIRVGDLRNGRRAVSHRARKVVVSATVAVAALLCGCAAPAGKGAIELRGQGRDPSMMEGRFPLAAYGIGPVQSSVYMTDLPVDTLVSDEPLTGQVVHVELLWKPIAGQTPMDSAATNASIRQIVFAGGEVGIYGGAGFVRIDGRFGGPKLSIEIVDASMSLLEATPGFVDVFSPATLSGSVVAVRSEERTLQVRRVVSQLVTNAFGATRIVDARPNGRPGGCPSGCTDVLQPSGDLFARLLFEPVLVEPVLGIRAGEPAAGG